MIFGIGLFGFLHSGQLNTISYNDAVECVDKFCSRFNSWSFHASLWGQNRSFSGLAFLREYRPRKVLESGGGVKQQAHPL